MKKRTFPTIVSEPPSEDDIQEKRFANMLRITNAGAFGALYQVNEKLWIEKLSPAYDQKSNRTSHPGCSIRSAGSSLTAYVPMLHGSSSKPRTTPAISVADVFGDPHTTYFGGLDPTPLPITDKKQVSIAAKGRVTPDEERALRKLCQQKGWLP